MEQIRSFIAIEIPAEVKAALSRLQAELKADNPPPAKWTDPYGIHLTLKFLGNIGVDRIEAITTAMEEAAKGISAFRLEIKGLGAFPNLKRVQIIWVGIGGELDRLSRLQGRIESNLATLGFAPETRPFSPHLTLARLHDRASLDERQSLGRLIENISTEAACCSFNVGSINLMRSQLTREGAIYSLVSSSRLT